MCFLYEKDFRGSVFEEMHFWENPHKTTEEIAQKLLGHLLVKESPEGTVSGWIVETEAYLGIEDAACHSYQGKRTPRLHSMYQKAGTIYVYQMHSHHLLNLITQQEGDPQGVLIRAIEPVSGLELMEDRRKKVGIERTNGPGKLTKAMGIIMEDNGTGILEPPLYIDPYSKKKPKNIELSPRVGIPNKGKWTEALLRYAVKGNPYISKNRGTVFMDNGWADMVK